MNDTFKEDMFYAIGLIGKKKVMKKPEKELLDKLDKRLKEIRNKTVTCKGYSDNEKEVRYEELLNVIGLIKDIFHVEL